MWTIMAWQHISPELTVKGFKRAVYPAQWMGLMICCRMSVRWMEMLGVKVRKIKVPTVQMLTATLIGEGI
jgi:hypothetical protein